MTKLRQVPNFRANADLIGPHSLSPVQSVSFPRYHRAVAANDNAMKARRVGAWLIASVVIAVAAAIAFIAG